MVDDKEYKENCNGFKSASKPFFGLLIIVSFHRSGFSPKNSFTEHVLPHFENQCADIQHCAPFPKKHNNKTTMNSTSKSLLVLTIVVASAQALSLFGQKRRMENVVRKYFDGVNKKDPVQIQSCFGDEATICDVVVSSTKKTVKSQVLAERCMDFVTAHPDCLVEFHYG
jgi:hypothetical protein